MFLSKNLNRNKLKKSLFFGKAVTVFLAQALRRHQQHTLQSLKNTFSSRNLDQNMLKHALFFEKTRKIAAALGVPPPNSRWPPAAGGLRSQTPRVVTPITCYTYFFESFCSATVITMKKERK